MCSFLDQHQVNLRSSKADISFTIVVDLYRDPAAVCALPELLDENSNKLAL